MKIYKNSPVCKFYVECILTVYGVLRMSLVQKSGVAGVFLASALTAQQASAAVTLYGTNGSDNLVGTDVAQQHIVMPGGDANPSDGVVSGDGADTVCLPTGRTDNWVTYSNLTSGIIWNLTTGIHTGYAQGDTYNCGVNLYGMTNFDDDITGDSKNNKLYGLEGNDKFHDTAGWDLYDGGEGSDHVVFLKNHEDYTIAVITGGYTVKDNTTGTVDTVKGIELIEFADKYIYNGALTPKTPPQPQPQVTTCSIAGQNFNCYVWDPAISNYAANANVTGITMAGKNVDIDADMGTGFLEVTGSGKYTMNGLKHIVASNAVTRNYIAGVEGSLIQDGNKDGLIYAKPGAIIDGGVGYNAMSFKEAGAQPVYLDWGNAANSTGDARNVLHTNVHAVEMTSGNDTIRVRSGEQGKLVFANGGNGTDILDLFDQSYIGNITVNTANNQLNIVMPNGSTLKTSGIENVKYSNGIYSQADGVFNRYADRTMWITLQSKTYSDDPAINISAPSSVIFVPIKGNDSKVLISHTWDFSYANGDDCANDLANPVESVQMNWALTRTSDGVLLSDGVEEWRLRDATETTQAPTQVGELTKRDTGGSKCGQKIQQYQIVVPVPDDGAFLGM